MRRPRLHFTPAANWLNDPNGLVFHNGEYHLFFQYHPHSSVWGPMHWGHAISADLITWRELPIALYPDELGMIFSGSAVIDHRNTAGFGEDAMVAIFTHHVHEGHVQSQSIAYSVDNGRTWTKYAGNPVIATPAETRDFRDPKVFWYGDADNGHWVMCLAVGRTIQFYTSPNLLDWSLSGSFGDVDSQGGVWETPDLFQLPVVGTDETGWVLLVGVGDGAPAGGSGQRYFVGRFDGLTFTSDYPLEEALWLDYGADFYAAQSWTNAPDGRRLVIAWMSNWRYARDLPASGWRGAMTLPRALELRPTAQGPRLRQTPAVSLAESIGDETFHTSVLAADGETETVLSLPEGHVWQIDLHATLAQPAQHQLTLHLRYGDGAESVSIHYIGATQTLIFDRRGAGDVAFHADFAARHQAPLSLNGNVLDLQLIVDASSVELFAQDGLLSMTELVFPSLPLSAIQVDAQDAPGVVVEMRATKLVTAR